MAYMHQASSFRKTQLRYRVNAMADNSRHSTTHHPGAQKRGGVAVILLLLKCIQEKQHFGLRQEVEKIGVTARSKIPLSLSGNLGLYASMLLTSFLTFFPFHLPLLFLKTAVQPSLLSPLLLSPWLRLLYSTHPLTPTLSISSSSISALMDLLSMFIHLMSVPHSWKTHIFCCLETMWCSSLVANLLLFCLVSCGFRWRLCSWVDPRLCSSNLSWMDTIPLLRLTFFVRVILRPCLWLHWPQWPGQHLPSNKWKRCANAWKEASPRHGLAIGLRAATISLSQITDTLNSSLPAVQLN